MEQDRAGQVKFFVELSLRCDKSRGTLIDAIATDTDTYFFKFHDQPVARHCKQIQGIVLAANVKRSKKISVDISEFLYEYFQNGSGIFKGVALDSVNKQIGRVCVFNINKEIGAKKRSITAAGNRITKIQERNAKLLSKMEAADLYFQGERARRINEFFGGPPPQTWKNARQK